MTTNHTTALARGLLVAGLGLGLAACGGGDDEASTDTTTAAAGAATTAPAASGSNKKACDLVTKADFQTAFGFEAKEATEGPSGSVATCAISGVNTNGSDVTVGILSVRYNPSGSFEGEQGAVERTLKATPTSVSGIGDKASLTTGSVAGSSQTWITVGKGASVLQISAAGLKDAEAPAKVQALATAAIGRL